MVDLVTQPSSGGKRYSLTGIISDWNVDVHGYALVAWQIVLFEAIYMHG